MSDFIEGINAAGKKIFEISEEVTVVDEDKATEINEVTEKQQKDKE